MKRQRVQAKKSSSRRKVAAKKRGSRRASWSWWRVLRWGAVLVVVSGLLGLGYYYLSTPKNPRVAQSVPRLSPRQPHKRVVKHQIEARKPRFEFYTILPKLNLPSPPGEMAKKIQHRYDIQVASTRSFKEAERLRARILLQGQNAHVARVKNKNGAIWYRVAIGPYTSSSDAQSDLKKLRKNNLDGVIRRLK